MGGSFVDSGSDGLVSLEGLEHSREPIPMEHERRFFLTQKQLHSLPFNFLKYPCSYITQGYLEDPLRTRIREEDKKGECSYFQTQKSGEGISRLEDERQISNDEFESMWSAVGASLEKSRYFIKWKGFVFELNTFHGSLDGYVQIEVEFSSHEDALQFVPADWMGKEVTDDPQHGNYFLAKNGWSGNVK
jgi:CYTH domain-containing protein